MRGVLTIIMYSGIVILSRGAAVHGVYRAVMFYVRITGRGREGATGTTTALRGAPGAGGSIPHRARRRHRAGVVVMMMLMRLLMMMMLMVVMMMSVLVVVSLVLGVVRLTLAV